MLIVEPLFFLCMWMLIWAGIAAGSDNIWWLKSGALLMGGLPVALGFIGAVGAAFYDISPGGRRQRKREQQREERLGALIEETKLLYPKRHDWATIDSASLVQRWQTMDAKIRSLPGSAERLKRRFSPEENEAVALERGGYCLALKEIEDELALRGEANLLPDPAAAGAGGVASN